MSTLSANKLVTFLLPRLDFRARNTRKKSSLVCVVHWGNIGDFVQFSAVLREVRRNFPQSRIVGVAQKENAELARGCPYVDEWIFIRGHKKILPNEGHGGQIGYYRLVAVTYLKLLFAFRGTITAVIGPEWLLFPSLATLQSNLLFRKGNRSRRGSGVAVRAPDSYVNLTHQVPRMLSILESLGLVVSADNTELWVGHLQDSSTFYHELGHARLLAIPKIMICLGAGQRMRDWTSANLDSLVELLCQDMPTAAVLVTGPASLTDRAKDAIPPHSRVRNLVGKLSLVELALMIKEVDVVITNDSAPVHMASVYSTPTVVVSPHPRDGDPWHLNSPRRFGPWKTPSFVLQPDSAVTPCTEYCAAQEPHCVLEIQPITVVQSAIALMEDL